MESCVCCFCPGPQCSILMPLASAAWLPIWWSLLYSAAPCSKYCNWPTWLPNEPMWQPPLWSVLRLVAKYSSCHVITWWGGGRPLRWLSTWELVVWQHYGQCSLWLHGIIDRMFTSSWGPRVDDLRREWPNPVSNRSRCERLSRRHLETTADRIRKETLHFLLVRNRPLNRWNTTHGSKSTSCVKFAETSNIN